MPKFVPRERKHRKLARQKDVESKANAAHLVEPTVRLDGANTSEDVRPNVVNEHVQHSRKDELRRELMVGSATTSKKRKRLDKYIETKLRREDTIALIRRLEEKQKNVDRSLLQSAKTLGRRGETKKEILEKVTKERVVGAGIESAARDTDHDVSAIRSRREAEQSTDNYLSIERREENGEHKERNEYAEGFIDATVNEGDESPDPTPRTLATQPSAQTQKTTFGSGLKRPLELDEHGRPIIKSRKRKRTRADVFDVEFVQNTEQPEWTGFSDEEATQDLRDVESPTETSGDASGSDVDSQDEMGDNSEYELSSSESGPASESESKALESTKAVRTSAFKAWAERQRNDTIGFIPSTALGNVEQVSAISDKVKSSFVPRALEQDPLPEGFDHQNTFAQNRRAFSVPVQRTEAIQATRVALPVVAEEQRVMEAIFNHDVIIISGATGSGKTTQVPQFLFEYGFGDATGPMPGMIGVTQPRRVAAVSMAKRVSEELGDAGSKVAYQIRFDSTVRKGTAVKFMTDGVLLREMATDFSLRSYSAVIIDEAHERTVNTDILIALLSRCIKIRRQLCTEKPEAYTPLKLVIMSATLRVEDFRGNTRLFAQPPPLIEAEGRQYNVKVHWARHTGYDFVEEAFKRVSRGHRKLPHGGMLVFLTGQNEIRLLMRRLTDVFQSTDAATSSGNGLKIRVDAREMVIEAEDLEELAAIDGKSDMIDDHKDDSANDLDSLQPEDPDAEFIIDGEEPAPEIMKIHILPLYSQLASKEQLKVFEPPPPGARLIVLATNLAETSLTIPGIRYVFDCGRYKERVWDRAGVQTFRTTWISKASADQRMGRAGRTGPGHCYRLYSSAIYESAMAPFAQPEIYRTPLDGVVLQLKSMNIERVDNFPFPTPPESTSIIKAERLLRNLGALDFKGRITKVGRELQNYPLSPRFARMLHLGVQHGCTAEAITIVAVLDVPELIAPQSLIATEPANMIQGRVWSAEDDAAESAKELARKAYATAQAKLSRLDFSATKITPQSDALRLFAAMLDYVSISASREEVIERFCRDNFLREKGLHEASQLRCQLTNIVRNVHLHTTASVGTELKKPSEKIIALLKQVVAAGFLDQIAIRADLLPSPPVEEKKPKRAIDVKYRTLFSSSVIKTQSNQVADEEDNDGFVYIHPSSLLARLPANATPRYIVYQRLQRSQASSQSGAAPRVRMHPLTPVSAQQIASLTKGTGLLEVGKPLGKMDVLPAGAGGEERRECDVMLSLVGEPGQLGWPLMRKRVVQKRVAGEGWVVETWKD